MSPQRNQRGAAQAAPLAVILSVLPSLPRPVLQRLTARMIDRLDEMDGDPDTEDDTEDCCGAFEDRGGRMKVPAHLAMPQDPDGDAEAWEHPPEWPNKTNQRAVLAP